MAVNLSLPWNETYFHKIYNLFKTLFTLFSDTIDHGFSSNAHEFKSVVSRVRLGYIKTLYDLGLCGTLGHEECAFCEDCGIQDFSSFLLVSFLNESTHCSGTLMSSFLVMVHKERPMWLEREVSSTVSQKKPFLFIRLLFWFRVCLIVMERWAVYSILCNFSSLLIK